MKTRRNYNTWQCTEAQREAGCQEIILSDVTTVIIPKMDHNNTQLQKES